MLGNASAGGGGRYGSGIGAGLRIRRRGFAGAGTGAAGRQNRRRGSRIGWVEMERCDLREMDLCDEDGSEHMHKASYDLRLKISGKVVFRTHLNITCCRIKLVGSSPVKAAAGLRCFTRGTEPML